jgi:hypothetical protein
MDDGVRRVRRRRQRRRDGWGWRGMSGWLIYRGRQNGVAMAAAARCCSGGGAVVIGKGATSQG